MSLKNVEIVRRIYQEVSAHLDVSPELFDPNYEMDMSDMAWDIGVLRGLEAAREGFRRYAQTFDDFRIELREVIHADEQHVVTEIRDGGRMKGSGAEVWNRFFNAWTFRDGKIVRFSSHTDRARALQAAGISA
jgi:ketosteroid isomerase-like protein